MTHEDFVLDWTNRYREGTCTKEQLGRLVKINKLSNEEVDNILLEQNRE